MESSQRKACSPAGCSSLLQFVLADAFRSVFAGEAAGAENTEEEGLGSGGSSAGEAMESKA